MRALLVITALGFFSSTCGKAGESERDLDLVGKTAAKNEAVGQSPDNRKDVKKSSGPKAYFTVDLIEDLVFRKERDSWTLTTPDAHVNIEKLEAAKVGYVLSALPMSPGVSPETALEKSLEAMEALVAGVGGKVKLVSGFDAVLPENRSGQIAMGLLMEGADALVGRLDRVAELKKRGLAAVGLVAGRGNAFADAAVSPRDPGGLTDEGRRLLKTLREANIVTDLTHASRNAFYDALAAQSGKAMVSHTAVRALMEHPRNLDDLQIVALVRYGGLMGLSFNPEFLKTTGGDSIDDVVEHIMYVSAIGALGALALGTDFGGINPPRGLDDVSRLPYLAEELRARGLPEEEIAGVFGENAARFLEEVSRPYGEVALTEEDILRPVEAECESVIGEIEGLWSLSCDGYVRDPGASVLPATKVKVRIRDMTMIPATLELFGEPGVLWQVEGQNLDGKVLFRRILQLDDKGKGDMSLPENRNLTRVFFSPTRASNLREVVIWGRRAEPVRARRN